MSDDMEKVSAVKQKQEIEAWQRWSQDRNPQDFKFLLESYKPFMHWMAKREMSTAQLPKSAIEGDMIQNFHRALETYDPQKGQLNTHIGWQLRHTGRYLRTYTNIGKIPEPRARQIGVFQDRQVAMTERLGREPSSIELADDLNIDLKDIELLRKELRKDILVDDSPQGFSQAEAMSPKSLERINFLHMELNPDQQNVLEYTYGLHGRQAFDSNEDIARILNITSQRVRAIKRQIAQRYEKRYG